MPGSTAGNEYSPTAFVTVSRETPFDSLTSVTVTPGITPWASFTDPRKPPWKDCAATVDGIEQTRSADARMHATEESSDRIIHPPIRLNGADTPYKEGS